MSTPTSPDPVPFPTSQCHGCTHRRLSHNNRGSIFILCTHPATPKYLPQPVRGCPHAEQK